jgi:hypothetical protein
MKLDASVARKASAPSSSFNVGTTLVMSAMTTSTRPWWATVSATRALDAPRVDVHAGDGGTGQERN